MKWLNHISNVAAITVFSLILTGCPTRTSIAKINNDPGHFANREVTIAGQVTNSFGAMGSGVFQVDDGSGAMWVFSQHFGVPGNGVKLAVTGTITQGFSFGGRNFAVILKQSRNR
jgi:hypothetical protein